MAYRLAVDVGGTFTDLALIDEATGHLTIAKVPSTPGDSSVGVVGGVERLLAREHIDAADVELFIHGTTVATNTLLTRTGARAALITTAGFRDVLAIARQTRPKLYDFWARRPEPLISRDLRFEVPERVLYTGEVMQPLDEAAVRALARQIGALGVEIIAVCFLHSYVNPSHERRTREIILEEISGAYVTLSSDVLPEHREYERLSTLVVNAYVTPRVERYVGSLEARLRETAIKSDLHIMQSNGGIISAQTARTLSARTVLSGPAGGAMAAVFAARLTGRPNLITNDMGGTSADICLIHEGQPRYTTESEIAGYSIRLPMIDINTIGAGGGSIAWVDRGGALQVGPQSAGADPGPACYGKGGGLPTVTDANLVLGRISPTYFLGGEIALDPDAARAAVKQHVADPLGLRVEEAAEGIVKVVNANMVRGIRVVSVERGFDARNFSLLAFGGAGPLHAADLAVELSLGEVIVPPNPGITSAVGMLASDIRHDYVRTYVKPSASVDSAELTARYEELELEGAEQLRRDGMRDDQMMLVRSADVRYQRQSYELAIPVPAGVLDAAAMSEVVDAFHQEHRRVYGYDRPEDVVVLVSLRLTALGKMPPIDVKGNGADAGSAEDARKGTRDVYFDGQWMPTAIYQRSRLPRLASIDGPAIVEQLDSTTVIRPGQSATIDPSGYLIVDTARGRPHPSPRSVHAVDPITLEVVRNALHSAAEEMGAALIRTALSPNIKDRRDCSSAIYTPEGELIAQAENIPLHLGLMPTVLKAVLERFPAGRLEPGDALIINDPYVSGSHVPDVCIIVPVFAETRLVALVANLAHHVDMGGIAPGSMPINASEIFQEGLRIPPLKLRTKAGLDDNVIAILATNVRTPTEMLGDLQAQLAGCNVGGRRIEELAARYGVDFLLTCYDEILDYTERRMRAAIADLPDGTVTFEDYLEGDGYSTDELIPIKASLTITGSDIRVDFDGTSPQIGGSMNCTRAVTLACIYFAVKAVADPSAPANEGAFRPIAANTPIGSLVNPRFPAATSHANINTAQRVADVILGALAQIVPERVPAASCGSMNTFNIGGIDPRTGEYYTYVETYGGGQGALWNQDGMDGVHTNMTNTRNTPVEVIEIAYPLLVRRYALLSNTGGAGKHRGGCGLTREITLLDHDARITLGTERKRLQPWGVQGGHGGGTSLCQIVAPDGAIEELPSKLTRAVGPGHTIVIRTSGGGGYGDPQERDREAVARDVRDGLAWPETE